MLPVITDRIRHVKNRQANRLAWSISKDDYVDIVRANIKPVDYKGTDLNDVIFIFVKALQNISRIKF